MKPLALVTGASSGIGRAIAIELSKTCHLIAHGRNEARLHETLNACAAGDHHCWLYDLEQVDGLQAAFEQFIRGSGLAVTYFVHCAGIVYMPAIKTFDLPMIRKIIDTNAISAMLLTGSLLKRRIAGTTLKSIVFISSVTGYVGTRGKSLYGTSKGMLNAFVRASAVELAPKVRINSICPAAVRTPMDEEAFSDPAFAAAVDKRQPLGAGTPQDVANLVPFLLSDKARWITGQQFIIDGGALVNLTFK